MKHIIVAFLLILLWAVPCASDVYDLDGIIVYVPDIEMEELRKEFKGKKGKRDMMLETLYLLRQMKLNSDDECVCEEEENINQGG